MWDEQIVSHMIFLKSNLTLTTELFVAMFCPTCYLGGGSSFRESFLPLLTAIGVAVFTSAVMIISILN